MAVRLIEVGNLNNRPLAQFDPIIELEVKLIWAFRLKHAASIFSE